MAIKSTTGSEQKTGLRFPCLMKSIHNGLILLATGEHRRSLIGVSVHGGIVGTFSKEWDASAFEPYNGKITLENDNS